MPRPLNAVQAARKELEKPVRVAKVRKARKTTTMGEAAKVSVDKPLTEQQKKFAQYVAEGNTVPIAMNMAGYNDQPSYGYRMMKMPNIKRVIAEHQELFREASHLKRENVLDMLKDAYDMARLMSEPATMVSAAREIGKMCGFYEPQKIDVRVSMTDYGRLTDQELQAMIAKATIEASTEALEYDDASTKG